MSIDGAELNRQNALAGLRDALGEVNAAEQKVVRIMAAARELGATWQQIGDVLGISRQAAWERFADKIGTDRAGEPSS
jgi:hypothetical protein